MIQHTCVAKKPQASRTSAEKDALAEAAIRGFVNPRISSVFEAGEFFTVTVDADCDCGKGDYCPQFGKMTRPFPTMTVVATTRDAAVAESIRIADERGIPTSRLTEPVRTDSYSMAGSMDPKHRAWLWKVAVR